MERESLLLDILVDGRFVCQMEYFGGKSGGADYDARDIERFIETKRPSLKNKHYRIEFSNQRL